MRKFTVKSKKEEVTIYELDVEIVTSLSDPSVSWLKPGEYKAKILKPESFHMKVEKTVEGKKEKEVSYVPDVWCWHSLYDTYEEVLAAACKLIEQEYAFNLRKYGTAYTDVDIASACMCIKLEKLPGSDFKTDAEKVKELLNSESKVS